ncbi:hypothetical protein LTS10_007428 [Elasticomyces elasticus]|nr:hypothetical protein LTS10_007428 [Elasticomyces elasticus]
MPPAVISGRISKKSNSSVAAILAKSKKAADPNAKPELTPVTYSSYHGLKRVSMRNMPQPEGWTNANGTKAWCKQHGETSGTSKHTEVNCRTIQTEAAMAEGKPPHELPHSDWLETYESERSKKRRNKQNGERKFRDTLENLERTKKYAGL